MSPWERLLAAAPGRRTVCRVCGRRIGVSWLVMAGPVYLLALTLASYVRPINAHSAALAGFVGAVGLETAVLLAVPLRRRGGRV
jgi:hypothetical protein